MADTADIKKFLEDEDRGSAADWKRVSKKKVHDGTLRTFENRKTGETVKVLEDASGAVSILKDDARAENGENLQNAFAKVVAPPSPGMPVTEFGRSPLRETDPDKNAAADRIVKKILRIQDVKDADLILAGKALANRIGFGLALDRNGDIGEANAIRISIAPLANTHYDQEIRHYIGHLLPEGLDETSEASFEFTGHQEPLRLAEDLLRRGFVFSPKMQKFLDDQFGTSLMNDLKALETRLHRGEKAPTSKPKPLVP